MDEFDGLDPFMIDGRIQKVWQRSPEEIRRMHGKISRTWVSFRGFCIIPFFCDKLTSIPFLPILLVSSTEVPKRCHLT